MDPSFKERFRHEGRIQAALDHPHIVTIFEAGEWDDSLFIAMRLVRGPNLKEMIIARELEGARTLRILRPIAEALDSAHEAGLIHRDIKPQNILVGSRDRAYLADFGLTKGIDDAGLTQTGQFVGTIDYIAPEQIRGEPATNACDIYALSAVLYECLTGAVPYPKPSDAAVMYAHLSEPPPLVTDQRPELPPNLDEVICKAMDKDPKARYASATALIDEAERALGKRVRAVITPPGPIEGPEEAGIREKEARVPTRPERVRRHPEPVPDPAPAPAAPTTPGRGAACARSRRRGCDRRGRDRRRRRRVAEPADPTVGRARPCGRRSPWPRPSDPTVESRAVAPAGRPDRRLARGAAAGVRRGPADPTVASPAVRQPSTPADATVRLVRPVRPGRIALRTRSTADLTSPPTVAMPAAERGASARRRRDGPRLRADRRWRGGRRGGPARRRAAARARRASFALPVDAAAAVALVIAAVAGYFLGKPDDKPAPPKADTGLSSSTTAGALNLRFPGSWERRGEAPKIPGLALKDQVAVGPASSQGQGVIAGMSDATGPRLLPAAFLASLAKPPRPGRPREARQARGAALRGARRQRLRRPRR